MLPELHRNISTKTTTWYFIRPYRFYKPSSSLSCKPTKRAESYEVERNLKTFGTATERESTEAVFLILPLSDKRTEVKLSLYRNELTVTRKNEVNQKQTSHTMLLKESTYDKWLNKLKAEVKRRKKLV